VGLAGTATQASNNSWFIEWGPLVLQDKKLLAIDGAHKLGREHWAQLAESERTGKIQIMKAGKGEAYARTRQIKIMNPISDDFRTTRTMKSFFYPAQAIVNNLQIQSIARQDLAVFVSDDVTTEDRNIRNGHFTDKKLWYLSDLLSLTWDQNFTVTFEEEAQQEIITVATNLERRFKHDEIPLITNDQKHKIAKLSASLAALTCSFNDDFKELIITREHVQYISNIIETSYHNSGLDIISRNDRDDVDQDTIAEIILKIKHALQKKEPPVDEKYCKDILLWCAQKTKFSKAQIQTAFELAEKNELNPLTAVLRNHNLLDQRKGFIPTSKLIKISRILLEENNQGQEGFLFEHGKDGKDGKTSNDKSSNDLTLGANAHKVNPDNTLPSLPPLQSSEGIPPHLTMKNHMTIAVKTALQHGRIRTCH